MTASRKIESVNYRFQSEAIYKPVLSISFVLFFLMVSETTLFCVLTEFPIIANVLTTNGHFLDFCLTFGWKFLNCVT